MTDKQYTYNENNGTPIIEIDGVHGQRVFVDVKEFVNGQMEFCNEHAQTFVLDEIDIQNINRLLGID